MEVYYPNHSLRGDRETGAKGEKSAGRKLPIRTVFRYGGSEWRVPAAYLFKQGVVLDICRRIEAGPLREFWTKWNGVDRDALSCEERMQMELENPSDCSPQFAITLNGTEILSKGWSGTAWWPFSANPDGGGADAAALRAGESAAPSGRAGASESPDDAAFQWMEAYNLTREAAWQFYRVHFPCPGAVFETVRFLTLRVEEDKKDYPCGKRFAASPGCEPFSVVFTHPVSGKTHTVRVLECREDMLENGDGSEEHWPRSGRHKGGQLIWPSHFCRLDYRIEPELNGAEDGTVRIQDVSGGDPPVRVREDGRAEDESGCAISVIGGACGPTAVYIAGSGGSGPGEEPEIKHAFSSVYFGPPRQTEWMVILSYTPCVPEQFDLTVELV